MSTNDFITTGELARRAGVPLHRVTYALQRFHLDEDARAGTYRLYRRARLSQLLRAIHAVGHPARSHQDRRTAEGGPRE